MEDRAMAKELLPDALWLRIWTVAHCPC